VIYLTGIPAVIWNFRLIAVSGPRPAHLPPQEHGYSDHERRPDDQRWSQGRKVREHAYSFPAASPTVSTPV
jgi:hypothetical protein